MYKQILAPLDGTEQAEYALAAVARLARRTSAWATLMQVVIARATCHDRAVATAYLTRVRRRPELREAPIDIIVREGSPASQIVDEAERRKANLIIISHRRYGPMASLLLGSVAKELARTTHIPLLVLHADDKAPLISDASRAACGLVPLDGSPFAEQAIPHAIELLRALSNGHGAALHLTYVLDPAQAYHYDTPETDAMRHARSYLAGIARTITADPATSDIAVTWAVETDKQIAPGIARVAEKGAYGQVDYFDFVAMATHGREGLAHWLAGSVTEQIIREAHAPVLIVHPQREEAEAYSPAAVVDTASSAEWSALV